MQNKIYITTTLPYTNAEPHLGHTLEFIQADVIVRYLREKLGAENVWFNLGADENGLKMYQKSQEEGITPKEYVDKWSNNWKDFCKLFQIEYDTFYRTSDQSHHEKAQQWWKISEEKGDIYKKEYTGLYCVGCEEFKTEKEIVDGKCVIHKKELIEISEENYFFKLSKYKKDLLDWLEEKPQTLKPESKLNELRNWISDMEDISISRVKEKLPWGVEVPGDPTQVMYVWFDALTNYINVLDIPKAFTENKKFDKEIGIDKWWPGIQLFGPDNLRFQGAIWQGMLASFGIPHTKKLLGHGMILASDGTKMSKSLGNGISPFEQQEKYGIEALRLYLIAGIGTYHDSSYKEDELVNIYNSYLADTFGNLLNRVIHLSKKYSIDLLDDGVVDTEVKNTVEKLESEARGFFDEFELQSAVQKIHEIASFGNEYITKIQPWQKDIPTEERTKCLKTLGYILSVLTNLYSPIIPASVDRAKKMLAQNETGVLFEKLQ